MHYLGTQKKRPGGVNLAGLSESVWLHRDRGRGFILPATSFPYNLSGIVTPAGRGYGVTVSVRKLGQYAPLVAAEIAVQA